MMESVTSARTIRATDSRRRDRVRARCRTGLGLLVVIGLIVLSASSAAAQDVPASPVAVSVSGTSTLVGQVEPGTTTIEDGVVRTSGAVLITIERSSDPRVEGQGIIRLDIEAYPGPDGRPGGAQVRYGSMRLQNEAGGWQGRFAGRMTETGFTQTYWLSGDGDYEGLTYVVTAGGDGNVWLSSGLIYPGAVPPMRAGFDLDDGGPAEAPPIALR